MDTPRLENYHQYNMYGASVYVGKVYNDKRFPAGTDIYTSPVVAVIGNYVYTRSGGKYQLGKHASVTLA